MLRRLLCLTSILLVFGLAGANIAFGLETFEVRVADEQNDNEEDLNPSKLGETDLDSSDLEFPYEDAGQVDPQLVGVRFQQVEIPAGKFIWNAWIRFQVDETDAESSMPCTVLIEGELSPDAAPFVAEGAGTFDISSRPVTQAKASWSVPAWQAVGDQGDAQTSVNISAVIQEIIDQPGWTSGNSIVLIIRDDPDNPSQGRRVAEHAPGDDSCLLHVEYENYPLNPDLAFKPNPDAGQKDVLHDTVLSWEPGAAAAATNGQIVYFGDSFEAVDNATGGMPQSATTYTPSQALEFGTTYYWRVDQVNASQKVSKGFVWSFEVESYSYMVPAADISAVASGEAKPESPALKTIDGSGLVDGLHSIDVTGMWLSNMGAAGDIFIQYEFRRPQLLQKMMVWNYNASSEGFVGWGIKDVTVEYSLDGETWLPFEQITSFTQAGGTPDYAAGDTFEFSPPVAASAVRIVPQSNYGGLLAQFGLSEVQFYAFPTYASNLDPADGKIIDLGHVNIFTWRPGRTVDQHVVLLSTDPNALAEVTSGPDAQYDILSSNPILGETYFWRVDEVNENEDPAVYTGDAQSFSVLPYKVVEDFEGYGNASPNRPFQTWLDGYGYSADDFFAVDYPGNGTGAGIGHDVWSPSSPDFQGDIMETDIRIAGSNKSMPVYYNNNSETTRTFASAQNWTLSDVQTLSLWFFGDTGNSPATLYVKLNNAKVPYDGVPGDLAQAGWHVWNIPLSAFNTNLQSVTSMSIGVEGSNVSGVLYFDDVRLYAQAGEKVTPVAPDNSALLGHWTLNGTLKDSSGKGNDGIAGGDPAAFVPGPGGAQALDFLYSYVTIDSFVDDMTDENTLTVSLWVKTASDTRGILVGANNAAGDHNFIMGIDGGVVYFDGVASDVEFPPAINDDQWHLVTFVRDGVQGTLYIDGLARGTAATDLSLAGMTRWSLGHEWDSDTSSDNYTGQIGDTRVYDYALSAEEIASLFGLTAPMHKPL